MIIPTYNNAGTIVGVVSRALEYCSDVIVVSDGCDDGTVRLLEGIPEKPVVIELERNSGKGNALREGFRYAANAGFAYAITLDADGQHYPEDIPLFLKASRRFPDAIIVGRRTGLDSVRRSKASSFANGFSNFWFFLQTLKPLKDTQTGYRLYPLRKLGKMEFLTSRYEAELELLVFSAWKGVGIKSQDIRVFYPPRNERVSHFRPAYDFIRICVLNCMLCLLALVYGLPRTILRNVFRISLSFSIFLLYAVSMMFVVTPGIFIFLKTGPVTKEKKKKLHEIIYRVNHTVFVRIGLPGIRYSLINTGGEDFSRPAVIICNHQSHLDLPAMLALTPKLVIVTADWVWNNPLYGFIIHNADFIPASSGLESLLPKLESLVKDGYSIAIYPEGTRSSDCSIGRFHQGAFYLSDKLNLDILPLVLYGTGIALPKHGRILKPWPVRLEADRRIPCAEMRGKGVTLRERASYMREYYRNRYREIADNIEGGQI